ncbi:type 1 fimbrial protein [Stenotrophomonas maltophilia]|uniref:fimbrial protein n=1 Tax=Stenotrophomonas maltophilia TaxID=40324 RepID=UPI0015DD6307|nr:fimbrial protein [Stenotrophomonas maltophilia]MBA0387058.1 type 1 fimbrial protein [Stenotrophomonas maltophilia]MBA0390156.1 type 1 fimbrial protein [Stenotrophomonas maltophilia]MBA0463685.1 type 1 fimbrial protein [Stenotrophomonas maltophilia]MBA0471199.1 type 1 fimbrial protein [Stenotrophomonas maltophilia]
MNKLAIALSAALSLGAAASVHAADATITFTGKVVASTCSVDIGGGGNTATVALRQINPGAFKSDNTVGSTPFTITLTAGTSPATCSADNARLVIDPAASDLSAAGMITDTAGGVGTRTSAHVKLVNAATDADINLTDLGDPALVSVKSSGNFTYNWIARYHNPSATDDLTAGDFSGKLVFDVDNY